MLTRIPIPAWCPTLCATLALAAVTTSCGPASEVTGVGPFEIPVERHREAFRGGDRVDKGQQALDLVKSQVLAEWGGENEALASSLADTQPGGQVLFPRWTSVRTAMERYSVRFSFTQLAPGGDLTNYGYVWPVDLSLQVIGERRALTAEELKSLTPGASRPIRVREPTYDLE